MIPLVGHVNELREVRRQLEAVAAGDYLGGLAQPSNTSSAR